MYWSLAGFVDGVNWKFVQEKTKLVISGKLQYWSFIL
jgi:hypothetical protein